MTNKKTYTVLALDDDGDVYYMYNYMDIHEAQMTKELLREFDDTLSITISEGSNETS